MGEEEKGVVKTEVLSEDPAKKNPPTDGVDPKTKKFLDKKEAEDKKKDEDMTEEDRLLKEKLEGLVVKVHELASVKNYEPLVEVADQIRTEIRTSTSSMTSVPKPLKFLRSHFAEIKADFETLPKHAAKTYLADVLSVMSMTIPSEELGCLKYRLQGSKDALGSWGHEYVRNLAGEIGKEYVKRLADKGDLEELLGLVTEILPYDLKHNAEAEAVDLLLEVDKLEWITQHANSENCDRIGQYLLGFSNYVTDHEELEKVLGVTYTVYMKSERYAEALRVALKLDNFQLVSEVFSKAEDPIVKSQLGFILSHQKLVLEEFVDDEKMMEVIGNGKLHEYYLDLARDLEVLEPKSPDDIYKQHLVDSTRSRRSGTQVDSAKANLASTFVNAFVNAGFCDDTLMTPTDSQWVFKNKDSGKFSAVASLGLLHMWDLESGFAAVDKYTYQTQEHFKAGALLATGLVSAGVTSELDAAFALLVDHVESRDTNTKVAAILGLGYSYAGSAREDILELLSPLVSDLEQPLEVSAFAALALGMVFVGQKTDQVSGGILEAFMGRDPKLLNNSLSRFFCLGLGLLFLGKGEGAEAIIEALKIIEHKIQVFAELSVRICAYCGTGNVLEIQKMLSAIGEHIEEAEENQHQGLAVLGIAIILMGENLGAEMSLRMFDSILQYAEVNVRRAVPLALGLLSISNPKISIMETLSKLSHDHDEFVSQNAVFALGLIGAGTNNSRIAQLLRSLSVFYGKEQNHLFLVRIAQGLLHLGKGLLTLAPFLSDGLLLSKVSFCGIATVLFSMLDANNTILGDRHHLLYAFALAMRPRSLFTLDEDLKPKAVTARVGQAVDTVGLAGKPRSITGFQTHSTPVLIGVGERAELATEEFLPLTNVLEGFVILKKNPEYKPL